MFKLVKRLKNRFIFDSEYHYGNCECGGRFKQKEYITTVGGIDEEQFYDLWKCKCTKCGKYKDLDFEIET